MSSKKIGPFVERSRTLKYQNKWIRVEEASVTRPDGSQGIFGLVYMNPGTTVVALDDENRVFLIREFKYAVSRETVELISGALDENETPVDAGIRELHEETGYRAKRSTYLGAIDPFTTVVSSPNHIILAEQLEYDPPTNTGGDIVEAFQVPFTEALRMVEAGEITHGASCVALLRADMHLRKRVSKSLSKNHNRK